MLWRAVAVYILLVNILPAILGAVDSAVTASPSVSAKVLTGSVRVVSLLVGSDLLWVGEKLEEAI